MRRALETTSVRFSYAVSGAGPAVILIPGSGGWRLSFDAMVRQLSASHTVYAVDPPGQGGTRVVDSGFGYGVDAIVEALAQFLTAAGLPAVAVVGHSWGGGYALRLAQLHPGRVERLALLAPAGLAVPDVWEFRVIRWPVVGEVATRFTSKASVRHMLRKSFAHPDRLPPDALLAAAAHDLRSASDAAALRRDMLRVERGVDWTSTEQALGSVRCPVLILWGDRDRYLPVDLLPRFTANLPHAEAHVLKGAGHSLHDDAPDLAYPLLTAFLSR
jgi:pimeloyl-ACP methyl ester carboxylesterase